nr:MAG TPA: hypothetical protein [Caudoviricetes sp.]
MQQRIGAFSSPNPSFLCSTTYLSVNYSHREKISRFFWRFRIFFLPLQTVTYGEVAMTMAGLLGFMALAAVGGFIFGGEVM